MNAKRPTAAQTAVLKSLAVSGWASHIELAANLGRPGDARAWVPLGPLVKAGLVERRRLAGSISAEFHLTAAGEAAI